MKQDQRPVIVPRVYPVSGYLKISTTECSSPGGSSVTRVVRPRGFVGKCLISGPDTLRPCKHKNRSFGKFLSVDLCSLKIILII